MTQQQKQATAAVGIRLIDDAYTVWLSAETECDLALRAWFEAGRGKHADAYFTYRAALDREDAAARDLQLLSEMTEPVIEDALAA